MRSSRTVFDFDDRLRDRARGPAPGTTTFAPPPDRVKAIANSTIDRNQFEQLLNILRNTNAGRATPDFENFAGKLEEITRGKTDSAGNSIAVTKDQAKAIALNPTDMNHFLEGLRDKGIIGQPEVNELKNKAQHFVNAQYKTKVDIALTDTALPQIVQKTKNALQSNVPVDDALKALTAHYNERNENGKPLEAAEINKVIDALEQAKRDGKDAKQALDTL